MESTQASYHWDGLHLLEVVKSMEPIEKLQIFMHIIIEKEIMLKHTSIHWKNLQLPNFAEITDEWLCHYGVRFDLINKPTTTTQ